MKHFFESINAPYVAEVTTTLFFALFVAVLLWCLRPGARKKYEEAANLPLEEGDLDSDVREKQPDSDRKQRENS